MLTVINTKDLNSFSPTSIKSIKTSTLSYESVEVKLHNSEVLAA